MKKELQIQFKEKYPKLYKTMLTGRKEGIPFHCIEVFGFECGDGWFKLLDDLSAKIEELINKLPEEGQQCCYINQVKEKFGGLRFYMNSETDEMSELIREAEEQSCITCEVCGQPGKLMTNTGWWYTACENCRKAGENIEVEEDDPQKQLTNIKIKV